MSDDAEFDAFLKGEDALSRRMQAMPQAVPSAALDAAILQRAKDLMAQEARPKAANDAGASTPAPRVAGLGWRWRVPAGIAATVLAGVFAHQAFQASVDMENRAGMPADESAVVMPAPVAEPERKADMVPAPVASEPLAKSPTRARPAAPAPAPVLQDRVAKDKAAPAEAASIESVIVTGMRARSSVAMKVQSSEEMAPPPPVAAPAPASAAPPVAADVAAAPAAKPQQQHLRAEHAEERALERTAIAGFSASRAESVKAPAEWLATIEAMLGGQKDAQVLDEWRRFRKMYPDYPVPQTTEERIKALQK